MLEPGDIDVVVELDDDGLLIADDVFTRVRRLYAAETGLGIVSFRIADERGQTLRRHVPRLRAGDPLRRGRVTAFLGGGHALSAPMLRQIGDWPGHFQRSATREPLSWWASRRAPWRWQVHCPRGVTIADRESSERTIDTVRIRWRKASKSAPQRSCSAGFRPAETATPFPNDRLQDSVPPMSPQLAAEVVEAEAQRGCHRPRDSCRQGSARSPGTGDQRIGHLGAPR